MTSWKTTFVGCMLAGLMAISPMLDGSGYKLDGPTTIKMVFAFLIAVFSTLAKDHDVNGTSDAKDSKKN
jgi:hypothetical protein